MRKIALIGLCCALLMGVLAGCGCSNDNGTPESTSGTTMPATTAPTTKPTTAPTETKPSTTPSTAPSTVPSTPMNPGTTMPDSTTETGDAGKNDNNRPRY